MMIGRIALSSKLPCAPAAATIESSPITCRQTITIASCCVGLILPGMIDEPGSFSGRRSSCSPARGPDASQRMSLAIFISATATPRNPALVATIGSREPCGDLLAEPVRSIQPRADGRAAGRELVETHERLLEPRDGVTDLRRPARPLLSDGERHCILEMGPADLDHVDPCDRLLR